MAELDEIIQAEVAEELKRLGNDYDTTDMNRNDLTILQRMATVLVRLTSSEAVLEQVIRSGDISISEAQREEQRLSTMRTDLLKLQDSLGIARSKRKSSIEEDPRLLFQDIKQRAAKFFEDRLSWILCPKCKTLICSVNFLYPDEANKLTLVCGKCGETFTLSSKDILKTESKNPYK